MTLIFSAIAWLPKQSRANYSIKRIKTVPTFSRKIKFIRTKESVRESRLQTTGIKLLSSFGDLNSSSLWTKLMRELCLIILFALRLSLSQLRATRRLKLKTAVGEEG